MLTNPSLFIPEHAVRSSTNFFRMVNACMFEKWNDAGSSFGPNETRPDANNQERS